MILRSQLVLAATVALLFSPLVPRARALLIVNPWVPIFKGVEHATAETDVPRPEKVNVLRIDLWDADLELFSTPSNGAAPLETVSRLASGFLTEFGVQVAVNANFACCVYTYPTNMDLFGLAISQGTVVSAPAPAGDTFAQALVVTRSNIASIVTATPSFNTSNVWTAIGGAEYVLQNGVNVGVNPSIEPRTFVGLSQNNRYLFLCTLDGRQTGYSEGANHAEMGDWLLLFGAYVGFNLDGGGSTTMVQDNGLGGATVLNRPISGGIPGNERYVCNHLGAYAPRLAPSLVTSPQSQTNLVGQNPAFTVLAGGSRPLTYRWLMGATPVAGGTNAALTLSNAQPASAGNYTVSVSNNLGSVTSAPVTLTLLYSLTTSATLGGGVARSPNATNFLPNAVVTLTATPNPGLVFTGWSGDASGTNNPLNVTMNAHKSIVANFAGTPSDIIIDNPQATLTGTWATRSVVSQYGGDHRTTSVVATNVAPTATATYRPLIYTPGTYEVSLWYPVDSPRSTNAPWSVRFSGGTNTVSVNQSINGGGWRPIFVGDFLSGTNGYVQLANNAGGSSLALVMADAVKFAFVAPPAITNQPASQTVLAGQAVLFNVGATGTSPLNYYWRFNTTPIASATNSSYAIAAAQTSHAGNYTVVITNLYGAVTSLVATLTVNAPPFFTAEPASQSVNQAVNVTFNAAAGGSAPLYYQWRFNTVDIGGATGSGFTRTNVQSADAGNYSVRVTNLFGAIISSNAALTVSGTPVAPFVTLAPQSQGVIAGQNAAFTVAANGTLPLTYQWRFNGATIPGATATALALTNVQPPNAGGYSVLITNSAGATTSIVATLTVNYSLTAIALVGGTVARNPDQAGYASNALVTLTPTPDPGFTFTGWSGDAGGSNNPLAVTMTANKVIVASFSGAVADLILDNVDAGVTFSGSWSTGTAAPGHYGADYRFVGVVSNTVPATAAALYRPNITTPGKYDVYLYYPQGSNRSTNAQWLVAHENGSVLVSVDQTINGGGWRRIAAAKNFGRGTNGFVQLSNDAGDVGKVVLADAVRFAFAPAAPRFDLITVLPDGRVRLTLSGDTGFTYALEASTNLVNWLTLTNLANLGGTVEFIDAEATNLLARYYRARLAP